MLEFLPLRIEKYLSHASKLVPPQNFGRASLSFSCGNSSEGKKHASQRNKMKVILVDALWYKVQDTVKFDLQELCLQTMAAISERSTSKNLRICFHATVFSLER